MAERKVTVAVTGAGGFIGQRLVQALGRDGRFAVRACFRALPPQPPRLAASFEVGDIAGPGRWGPALAGADAVVHAAARVHVMRESAADPLAEYRRINVEGTTQLARAAQKAGVRRVLFLSSIKVNGESTEAGEPFRADDPPAPRDAYAMSKREAEDALREMAGRNGLEVTILRLPLVYGPGVKGNLERLMGLVLRGIPLPFARIDNRRSMLGVDNLASAIMSATISSHAAGRTYLLSDGEDLSTPALIGHIAEAMGRRPWLMPVPVGLLRAAGAVLGRGEEIARVTGSLTVDGSPFRQELDWRPPVTPAEGIAAMARAFLVAGAGRRG